MNANQQMIRAFQIFDEYDGYQDISAEHDVIYAGPDPENVSVADKAELASLGWHPEREFGCFRRFT